VRDVEDHALIVLLVAVSLAFAWILWPFSSAILWATVLAIVFAPLYRRLLPSMGGRQNAAAIAAVLIIVTMVIIPLTLTAASVLQEATNLYETIEAGQTDFGQFVQQVINALPTWATDFLNRFGLTDLSAIQSRLSAALVQGSKTIATQALSIGKGTANFVVSAFVMLYLLFFFLRDGAALARRIKDAIPLPAEQKRGLFTKFTIVIRAMFKGTLLVAALQGALGGLIFVWLPTAIYFLATGAIWEGIVLIAFGAFVIGLVDNLLRPFLVGKDTELPDYVVLISTLGGISIFGLNGFVIGPVIAAMFIAVWDIFSEQASEDGGASR
jgi:predicted PurR-regulated permease PerM